MEYHPTKDFARYLAYSSSIEQAELTSFRSSRCRFPQCRQVHCRRRPGTWRRPRVLGLAAASEPPGLAPAAAAAADTDAPLAVTSAERGKTPLTLRVFPVAGVWVLIGEFRIFAVDVELVVRVSHQAARLILLFEVGVAATTSPGQVEVEKHQGLVVRHSRGGLTRDGWHQGAGRRDHRSEE